MKESTQKDPRRTRRTFSTELKRSIVRDLQNKLVTVQQVADEYEVSTTSVYRWINRFGTDGSDKPRHVVLELDSEQYQTRQLRERLLELQAVLGRKQLEIDYLNELIAISSIELGVDLKKTFESGQSSRSLGNAGRRTGE